jgi:hypothetical protein
VAGIGAQREAKAMAAAPAPATSGREEQRRFEACPGERSRTLTRDAGGRIVRRERRGLIGGEAYRVEERYGPDGRLLGGTLWLAGEARPLGPADLAPAPGLALAPTAAAAEAAPPACGP